MPTFATQSISKPYILHLYRNLLRTSRTFTSYNFRQYAFRRARDSFHAHASETDPNKIAELVKKAEQELLVMKRQGLLNSMYSTEHLVVEDSILAKKKARMAKAAGVA
ncbi:hypothetical protein BZG36_04284 [Bifiguratus adelaidae]|uniref:Complex 1 LYR protein domain-containing protein n=1 Tax=Bifiguratus adelaidae TaxID=1938954 RepID=A0A261XW92_9FUNG|nr:hypothetical protein BZG36_04284 [Bifiguratus adelaidae]